MTTAPLPRIWGRVRRVRFDRCQSPVLTSLGTRGFGVATSSGSVAFSPPRSSRARCSDSCSTVRVGTEPVFTMAGVFLGMLAGGLGFWARVHAALK